MSAEYYVFTTQEEADTCIAAINGTDWFPIVGKIKGVPAPDKQKTLKWCEAPKELISGEWAVPRIPEIRLTNLGVPQGERDAFMGAYGQDVRTLGRGDFPSPVEA